MSVDTRQQEPNTDNVPAQHNEGGELIGAEGLPLSAYPGWDAEHGVFVQDDPRLRPTFRRGGTLAGARKSREAIAAGSLKEKDSRPQPSRRGPAEQEETHPERAESVS